VFLARTAGGHQDGYRQQEGCRVCRQPAFVLGTYPLLEVLEDDEEYRDDEYAQHHSGKHATHCAGTDGMVAQGRSAARAQQRDHTYDEGKRRHQYWAKPSRDASSADSTSPMPARRRCTAYSTMRMAFFASNPI